jgi:hypothetical protein
VLPAFKALKDLLVHKDHKALRELQVFLVLKVHKDRPVLVYKVLQAVKV